VCIAIRDVEIDEKNPWNAAAIYDSLNDRFARQITVRRIKLVIIPDIDSINIGREVGYDIIEHTPPKEVSDISGTKIRKSLKEKQ
jgi:hypothetical protein